jgi:hypothetical protein
MRVQVPPSPPISHREDHFGGTMEDNKIRIYNDTEAWETVEYDVNRLLEKLGYKFVNTSKSDWDHVEYELRPIPSMNGRCCN